MGLSEVSVEELEFVAALLTSARSLAELVANIETIVERIVETEQTGIYFYDEAEGLLRLHYAKGLSEEERRSAEATAMERHPGKVFRTRELLFVEDTQLRPEASSSDRARRATIRSRMYLPVMCHERCVGAFGLASSKPRAFTQAHVSLLSFTCNIAGVAHGQIIATERERALALESRLLRAQKHELLGTLAGSVAHDFNNLLTIIVGHAELLLLESEEPSVCSDLDSILHAAGRASSLARRLRAFSRQQAPAPAAHDLRVLVRSFEVMLHAALSDPWRLEIEGEGEGDIIAKIDASELEQAVLSLVLNARDAMSEGGVISLTFARRTLDVAEDRASVESDRSSVAGDFAELAVSDDGRGMDEATRARIFDPFFSTKVAEEGSGLGLATVRAIVQRHRGRIAVESTPGQGSCVRLRFPLCEPMPMPRPVEPAKRVLVTEDAGLRVLLTEDDPHLRSLLARVLTGADYRVIEAGNGAEALAEIRDSVAPFDLLVTDLRMPVMNGKQLLMAVEREAPTLRAMVISGYSSDLELQSDLREGERYPLLWKPFTPVEFLAMVTRLANKGRASSLASAN